MPDAQQQFRHKYSVKKSTLILYHACLPGPYFFQLAHFEAMDPMRSLPCLVLLFTISCWSWLQEGICGTATLRMMNVALALINTRLMYLVRAKLQAPQHPEGNEPESGSDPSFWFCTCLMLFPLHFFYIFIFYTDVASLMFVLACFLAMLNDQHWFAGLAAACAVSIRQTNVMWVAFTLYIGVLDQLGTEAVTTELQQPGLLLKQAYDLKWRLLGSFWPLLMVPISFCVFVVVNGGIVVGDRDAHKPMIHPAQMAYFFLFTAGGLAPVFIDVRKLCDLLQWLHHQKIANKLALFALAASVSVGLVYGTFAHPYLLADNRHYTFYLWRRVLQHEVMRWGLVPVCAICVVVIVGTLLQHCSDLWVLGFLGCAAATLVPAGLLEPR